MHRFGYGCCFGGTFSAGFSGGQTLLLRSSTSRFRAFTVFSSSPALKIATIANTKATGLRSLLTSVRWSILAYRLYAFNLYRRTCVRIQFRLLVVVAFLIGERFLMCFFSLFNIWVIGVFCLLCGGTHPKYHLGWAVFCLERLCFVPVLASRRTLTLLLEWAFPLVSPLESLLYWPFRACRRRQPLRFCVSRIGRSLSPCWCILRRPC